MNDILKDENGNWVIVENGYCPDYLPQMIIKGQIVGPVRTPRNFIEVENWNTSFGRRMTKKQKTANLVFKVVWIDGIKVYNEHMDEETAARETARICKISIVDCKRILNRFRFMGKSYFKV